MNKFQINCPWCSQIINYDDSNFRHGNEFDDTCEHCNLPIRVWREHAEWQYDAGKRPVKKNHE